MSSTRHYVTVRIRGRVRTRDYISVNAENSGALYGWAHHYAEQYHCPIEDVELELDRAARYLKYKAAS